MSLTSRVKNRVMDAINVAFTGIGRDKETRIPKSTSNIDPIMYEMYVANHLRTLANKRKELAEQAAVEAGIIKDWLKSPYPDGYKDIVAKGDSVWLHLTVTARKPKVDYKSVVEDLVVNKAISMDLRNRLVDKHTTPSASQHTFTPMLMSDE